MMAEARESDEMRDDRPLSGKNSPGKCGDEGDDGGRSNLRWADPPEEIRKQLAMKNATSCDDKPTGIG